ncbi:O-antigen ligase family protein [Bradyrhizobium lablabi]|uniref:O-antigen ligase family protein n=1 Tax=Bradyrhizobium lablabi TaxID=722472 RepID=UPI001BAC1BAE|nr:O-antigen ligase family protein [Bradyrhizobium lablabi]MBR1120240.1 O-antigen ligase family protein [Bradyrhizobium lablabi]
MSTLASPIEPVWRFWRWVRNPAFWTTVADAFAVLTALALPWSTSAVSIFMLCWLGSAALMIDYGIYLRSLKRPIFVFPIALFMLAVIGMLWSGAPWSERLYAVGPLARLLVLPGLFYHFSRSTRGKWVFIAFLVSCTLMAAVSWIVAFNPGFSLKPEDARFCGIFVRNYIDQGQEFSLCAIALAYPVMRLLKENRLWLAGFLTAIALVLIVNMVFVIASRTALATMPLMLAVFAFRYLQWRGIVALGMAVIVGGLAWATTPRMCRTVETLARDFELYREHNTPTSAGLRMEYWKKSLRFIAEAPLVGHGTGSIRGLFQKAATGDAVEATGHVIANPHNQTFGVAIQWGVIGIVVLYAMWFSHLRLFLPGEGLAAWIGLLVVVQNVLTSLFNSHIFDFHAGWMYVLGVGVAGGMLLKDDAGTAVNQRVEA